MSRGVLESGVAEEHETVVGEAGHAGEAALDSLERAGALGGTGGELHHALARGGIVEATHGGAAARGGDANRESGTRSRDGETVRRAVARERGETATREARCAAADADAIAKARGGRGAGEGPEARARARIEMRDDVEPPSGSVISYPPSGALSRRSPRRNGDDVDASAGGRHGSTARRSRRTPSRASPIVRDVSSRAALGPRSRVASARLVPDPQTSRVTVGGPVDVGTRRGFSSASSSTPRRFTADDARRYHERAGRQMLVPWVEALVELSLPAPENVVLDLASGTGACAHVLAREIGTTNSTGRVVALDASRGMLEVARERDAALRAAPDAPPLAPVAFDFADACDPDAPWHETRLRAFDRAYCHQGLQHFANPAEALARVRKSSNQEANSRARCGRTSTTNPSTAPPATPSSTSTSPSGPTS